MDKMSTEGKKNHALLRGRSFEPQKPISLFPHTVHNCLYHLAPKESKEKAKRKSSLLPPFFRKLSFADKMMKMQDGMES